LGWWYVDIVEAKLAHTTTATFSAADVIINVRNVGKNDRRGEVFQNVLVFEEGFKACTSRGCCGDADR
jgi:hypothetical protein